MNNFDPQNPPGVCIKPLDKVSFHCEIKGEFVSYQNEDPLVTTSLKAKKETSDMLRFNHS